MANDRSKTNRFKTNRLNKPMRGESELIDVERRFDGESPDDGKPLSPSAEAYRAYLEKVRTGAKALGPAPPIAGAQFDSFMEEVRQRVNRSSSRGGGRQLWAWASLVTASLLVALSLLVIFNGAKPTEAGTEVLETSTELEGATTDFEETDRGATVWLHATTEDLW